MLDRFAANGIDGARVDLIGSMDDQARHLAHYHMADIALDTFPFSGATTTFQALWMGVPVVSLHGERFIGRMGASISHHAGLRDLVATDPADYVETAAALAGDLDRLGQLRAGLRQRVAASPLCDGRAYAQNVEDALLGMWERAGEKGR
jgi:predicted O-linked N-acetylglucosamine transferase (SPINDLY family)